MIFPTAYFPSINYLAQYSLDSDATIEVMESYKKQTCRNRCFLMSANGQQTLSVPVEKINGNHTLTRDVEICYRENWQQIHRRCIETNYRKAPYFEHFYYLFEPIFSTKYATLVELNNAILSIVLKIFKINKQIVHTTDFQPIYENDFRQSLAKEEIIDFPTYYQVFEDRHGFVPNLSILDLLFNDFEEAPSIINFLQKNNH